MTPEGRVKKLVTTYLNDLQNSLDKIDAGLYSVMFVPVGYGKRNQLDYTLCFYGHFVAIETKAPDEWLTPNQRRTALSILKAGGTVFVITGGEGLDAFKRWVSRVEHEWITEH